MTPNGHPIPPILGRARCVLLVLAIVLVWQLGSWVLVGRKALSQRIAGLAEIDLSYWRAQYAGDGRTFPRYIILQQDYALSIGPHGVESLAGLSKKLGLSLHVEHGPKKSTKCPECILFSHTVELDTPLWAEISTVYWHGASSGVDFRHHLVFCLGAWIHVSGELAGNT